VSKLFWLICLIIPAIVVGDLLIAKTIHDTMGLGFSQAFLIVVMALQAIFALVYYMNEYLGKKNARS
jgi:uncharacterized membrane-anchored protein